MTERVGFSQEMVNAFLTITSSGGEYIFTSKLKTNFKKLFHLHSVLQQKVRLSIFVCMCVWASCVCIEENRVENQKTAFPVYTYCKDRQNGRNWT